ncbi:DUF3592 domain-containing protein [Methyloversatilis thermotolerans]|uniref:DUF3592 domain-containing protein n=1 Tax=Methyloversatilis thermotolerans TaxID=1346290 RepID=UPI00039C76E5|nr:DUF3592 domain-containing protein [Methyloversatilis thermotolerans]
MASTVLAQAQALLDQLARGLRWPLLGLGLMLLLAAGWTGWQVLDRQSVSERMRPLPGRIEHFSTRVVRRSDFGLPAGPGVMVDEVEIDLSVRYVFSGRSHLATRYSLTHGNRFAAGSGEAIALQNNTSTWTPGATVSLWVDPEQPSRAVIDKRLPDDSPALLTLIALSGFAMLWLSIRGFRSSRP